MLPYAFTVVTTYSPSYRALISSAILLVRLSSNCGQNTLEISIMAYLKLRLDKIYDFTQCTARGICRFKCHDKPFAMYKIVLQVSIKLKINSWQSMTIN